MSYTPTTWASGDVVTAAKLNKLEQGLANGGGGSFIVTFTWNSTNNKFVANKTWAELDAAITGGMTAVFVFPISAWQGGSEPCTMYSPVIMYTRDPDAGAYYSDLYHAHFYWCAPYDSPIFEEVHDDLESNYLEFYPSSSSYEE